MKSSLIIRHKAATALFSLDALPWAAMHKHILCRCASAALIKKALEKNAQKNVASVSIGAGRLIFTML